MTSASPSLRSASVDLHGFTSQQSDLSSAPGESGLTWTLFTQVIENLNDGQRHMATSDALNNNSVLEEGSSITSTQRNTTEGASSHLYPPQCPSASEKGCGGNVNAGPKNSNHYGQIWTLAPGGLG